MLKVADGIYRGPRLNSFEAYTSLCRQGIRTVLNLERGYFEFFHGEMNEEVRLLASLDIAPIHLQLGDLFPPSESDLYSIVSLTRTALKRGGIYIHCLHGQDRTGLACAMIQNHLFNWKPEACIEQMFSLGYHRFPYDFLGWTDQLKRCLF